MPLLTVIRHAPTEMNKKGLFIGSLDVPCMNIDLKKVEKIAKLIDINAYSVCYVSPLKRAITTANAIFDKQVIQINDNIRERNLGVWEGKSKVQIKNDFPAVFNKNGEMDVTYTPMNGEPIIDFINRVARFVMSLHDFRDNEQIAVVTHNGVCKAIELIVEDVPVDEAFSKSMDFLKPKTYIVTKGILSKINYTRYQGVEL